jgi:hypothetical protein
MFAITKTPIVILSAPRTGSTALCNNIKNNCPSDVRYFVEPTWAGGEYITQFKECFYNGEKFILKSHLTFLHRLGIPIAEQLAYSKNVFRIRLLRNNVVKQIASHYIARVRNNQWHFKNVQELNDIIDIDVDALKESVQIIKHANNSLKNTNIAFDLELIYEDLQLEDTEYVVVPKTVKYTDVLVAVENLL